MKILKLKFVALSLLAMIGVSVFFTSCEQEAIVDRIEDQVELNRETLDAITQENQGTKILIDRVKVYESADFVDYYPVSIGMSAQVYKLQKQSSKAEKFYQLIKNSEKKNEQQPVKVTVEPSTGLIFNVLKASEQESKKWKDKNGQFWSDENLTSDSERIDDIDALTNLKNTVVFSDYNEVVQLHNEMNSYRCVSYGSNAQGCIPFNFKGDGCYARAHRMRQIMESDGKTCYKIFVFADYYNDKLLNVPGCNNIGWGYHVAPLVYADGEWYVIDPSLSNTPLTRTQWYSIMGSDNICDIDYTVARGFWPVENLGCENDLYRTDPNYNITNYFLDRFERSSGCEE